MCMTKNEMLNDISAGLVAYLDKGQIDLVKAIFVVKMQGYEIHEVNTLPSAVVQDNDFILKRFAVDMLAKGLKESSIKAYLNVVRPFLDHAQMNFTDITAQQITDYLAVKKVTPNANGGKNSDSYIATICRVLFVFFEWAYKKRHIKEDIMRDVDRVRARQKKKERLTAEEIESCREAARDDREKALLELMLSTGLRVGEIAALRIEDIDFQAKRLHVREGKTDNAERDVYLSVRARNAVQRYIAGRVSGYVFRPSRDILEDRAQIGKGTVEKIAKDIGKRAGVHCTTTVHVYRKTFASETYRRTKDVKLVSILLGHSSTAITEKYYLVDDLKDVEYQALRAV